MWSGSQDHSKSKPYLKMIQSAMSRLDRIIRLHIETKGEHLLIHFLPTMPVSPSSTTHHITLQLFLPLHPCPPCTSVSPHPSLHQWLTPPLSPSLPGSSPHHHHPIVTCCVSGKSSIKAQHVFGTAESCSPSSPTTSTKRQLSPTPSLLII